LTLVVTLALSLGFLIFAAVSLATIDRTLESALDTRLATTVHAVAANAGGRIAVPLHASTVRHFIRELGVQQNVAILTAAGTVALQSVRLPPSLMSVARAAVDDRITYKTVPDDGGLRVAAYRLPRAGGSGPTLLVWRSVDVIKDYERIAVTIFVVASLVIIGGAGAGGIVIVERSLAPLGAMAAIASEIEAHDLSRRLSNTGWDDELQTVAATFDRMLDRLESAFARQRQFTADASHDFRGPLAVISAEVDLALARAREATADTVTLRSIADEVRQLDRLLEALLLAARADAGPVDARPIDLAELTARAASRLASFAASRGVRIVNALEASPTIVVGDAEILERVLISLLHNGIKFSPPGGVVTLESLARPGRVSLLVRDEGAGFSDRALTCAFDRFWKDDAARGRSGTGLGLAIAKSAVERVGGSIAIRNALDGGAEIETTFPIATS
jgi:signal transduction histidine kinase